MIIYDRYASKSVRRRKQQAFCSRFPGLYRTLWIAKYSLLACLGLAAGFLFIEILARAMSMKMTGHFPVQAVLPLWGYGCAMVLIGGWIAFTIADMGANLYNLHTMAADETHFHVLSIRYQSRKQVCMAELKAIRILPARKPLERFHAGGGWDYRRERESYQSSYRRSVRQSGILCLPYLRRLNGRIQRPPMALLIPETGSDNSVWLRAKWPETNFLRDHIGFAILGDKTGAFIHLLKNSSCPVLLSKEIYEKHSQYLNALFTQSGMDLSRLQVMQEETRQAQMTRIIG